jgi:hypothetical protein
MGLETLDSATTWTNSHSNGERLLLPEVGHEADSRMLPEVQCYFNKTIDKATHHDETITQI